MTEKAHRDPAVSIRQRLLNLSRQKGEDFNLILTRFALERFLYRLSEPIGSSLPDREEEGPRPATTGPAPVEP